VQHLEQEAQRLDAVGLVGVLGMQLPLGHLPQVLDAVPAFSALHVCAGSKQKYNRDASVVLYFGVADSITVPAFEADPVSRPGQIGVSTMSEPVFKKIELTGSSNKSIEDAIQTAITRASKTVRHMRWFEVAEVRGTVDDDKVGQWQVTIKVGFRLED
jgi:flavin-binding protein dodecin